MYSKKVMSAVLTISMLSNTSCLVISMLENTPIAFAESASEENKIRYSSTGSLTSKNLSRVTLDVNYINDKYSNQKTAIVSLKGFIPSGRIITKQNNNVATMRWPYKYIITVESFCSDNEVKIVDTLPNNTIASKDVTKSVSYSVGGGINVSDAIAGSLNGSVEFSKSIQYSQPDYITVKTADTNNKASWKVQFAETREGYNVNSWSFLYGNEMFMRTRYGSVSSDKNFLEDYRLSDLIVGGFSPNMGVVLKGEKGPLKTARNSTLKVTLERVPNYYTLRWSTQWWGENTGPYKIVKDPNNVSTFLFDLDWDNYTIKPIE